MENRREFMKKAGIAALSLSAVASYVKAFPPANHFFDISLAQWSFQKSLFGGQLDHLDFPAKAKNDFGIDIVEYVSVFFNKKEKDQSYLTELKKRTDDLGVFNHLIMVDGEGDLGNPDIKARNLAVDNHFKWVNAAKFLGCKTIRVNASGQGTKEVVGNAVVEGLTKLTAFAQTHQINVVVENHGGYSSNGKWLADVMRRVDSKYCGTLPDFGNFRISQTEEYDKYLGVAELLPFAKAISAKTFSFKENGEETTIDYQRMFRLIKKSGWTGIVGIEYEGDGLSEFEGIKRTKQLLERVRT